MKQVRERAWIQLYDKLDKFTVVIVTTPGL